MIIIDDATEMTKEMWEHLGKVMGERVMDIVERLRTTEVLITHGQLISPVAHEAADEIERLREDKRLALKLMSEFLEKINRLRRGLHRIASIESDPDFGTLPISEAQKIAQDALEEE